MGKVKGKVLWDGAVRPGVLEYSASGAITGFTPEPSGENGPYVLPAFFDVHTHGGNMIDVNHITELGDVVELSRFYAKHGVGNFLVSVMTDTVERTDEILSVLAEAMRAPLPGARLRGIHLEGPFLAPEYKGAMPESLLRAGDMELFRRWQEIAEGGVKYLTLAPERPGMIDFARALAEEGVVVSMGHSAATYEKAVEAVEAGVRSSTHTFNAMKLFHMHEPAISGAALERDEVWCETIADGFHLHPATVRLIAKTKGWDKVLAVTDSIMAAGLPDGKYKLGVNDVIVKDGDAKLPDGVRAGSTLTMDRALRNLVAFTGAPLEEVSKAVSSNAAAMLGFSDTGRLEEGLSADITTLDEDLNVLSAIVGGRVVHDSEKEGNR